METIQIPKHMVSSFNYALNEFSKDGFIYHSKNQIIDDNGTMKIEMDMTAQESIALGIKIGYHLAKNSNNGK